KAFDEQAAEGRRDLVFIPVGINYDRVLEDRSQLLKLHPQSARPGRLLGLGIAAGFVLRNLLQTLSGGWHRFGYACVNFGTPFSMRAYAQQRGLHFPTLDEAARRVEVSAIAAQLMAAIGRIVPVLPVSLVASVLMRDPHQAWSELELKAAAHARMGELAAGGAHLYIPRQDHDYAFGVGLRMLTLRHIVSAEDGLYRPLPGQLEMLAYYANAIAHLGGV
ncbi:MAG: hypothetical protein NTY41_13250, partial [Proteobacteria bacterium]|nr:hypothetical protein [Pseudomonadota bacterium]